MFTIFGFDMSLYHNAFNIYNVLSTQKSKNNMIIVFTITPKPNKKNTNRSALVAIEREQLGDNEKMMRPTVGTQQFT